MFLIKILNKIEEVIGMLWRIGLTLDSLQADVAVIKEKITVIESVVVPLHAEKLSFVVMLDGVYVEIPSGGQMILQAGKWVDVLIRAKDAFGNDALLDPDNPPVFASSAPTVATVTPNVNNPLAATIKTTGVTGTAQISVVCDAKFGPEVKELVGLLDIQVPGGEATIVNLEAGVPYNPPQG